MLHSVKTKDDPLRLFLSGGAGVGKSTVTNALYEALIRYLNSIAGENPDDVIVVKAAPTGKVALALKTLHYILLLRYLPIEALSIVHWTVTD